MEILVQENAKIVGQKISEIELPGEALIAGIIRNSDGQIATPELEIKFKDKVIVLAHSECVKKLVKLFN
jgi:Trk K+ transport system NAD-binding subunit